MAATQINDMELMHKYQNLNDKFSQWFSQLNEQTVSADCENHESLITSDNLLRLPQKQEDE